MSEKKGPKAFKRWILDYKGEGILKDIHELMEEIVKKLDLIYEDHLVEDWVIEGTGEG